MAFVVGSGGPSSNKDGIAINSGIDVGNENYLLIDRHSCLLNDENLTIPSPMPVRLVAGSSTADDGLLPSNHPTDSFVPLSTFFIFIHDIPERQWQEPPVWPRC
jgi:hypothetical protein